MGLVKTLLKFVGTLVLVVVVAVAVTLFAARFADGPWAIIAGGPFTSGELVTTEPDWSFVKDIGEVEFQLVASGTSRTTWIMEVDNRIFIPSGYMNTTVGKLWKHWPHDAVEDGRVILRVEGKLYPRRMQRVMQDPALPEVLSEVSRKYLPQVQGPVPMSEVTSGNTWIFELLPE